jgi:hypothetical protein
LNPSARELQPLTSQKSLLLLNILLPCSRFCIYILTRIIEFYLHDDKPTNTRQSEHDQSTLRTEKEWMVIHSQRYSMLDFVQYT